MCKRAGIFLPPAEYLNGYLGQDRQVPNISVETVLKAAGRIEVMTMGAIPIEKEIVV